MPAGETAAANFTVKLQKEGLPLGLPSWWKVFTGVDAAQVDLARLASEPVSLPGAAGPVGGTIYLGRGKPLGLRENFRRFPGPARGFRVCLCG